eukprot:m.305623 g.305623  ORF g.305623 m.305623 type:complete len:818 (+) comp20184_c0_seq1:313-2766(+)
MVGHISSAVNLLLAGAILVLVLTAHEHLTGRKQANRCHMTYIPSYMLMNVNLPQLHDPVVRKLNNVLDSGRKRDPYKLEIYHENWETRKLDKDADIPVLFIPGNDGNPNQVRSLVSTITRLHPAYNSNLNSSQKHSRRHAPHFVFYTIDFGNALLALNGELLQSAVAYANTSVQRIMLHYPDSTPVLLVGHSMGGLVARFLIQDEVIARRVALVLTLATPHQHPVVVLDTGMSQLHSKLAQFCDAASSGNASGGHSTTLLSIGGGSRDEMVAPENTMLNRNLCVFDRNGKTSEHTVEVISIHTTAIPEVQMPMDHLCIMWCKQLVHRLAKMFHAFYTDASSTPGVPPRALSLAIRHAVIEKYLYPPQDSYHYDRAIIHDQTTIDTRRLYPIRTPVVAPFTTRTGWSLDITVDDNSHHIFQTHEGELGNLSSFDLVVKVDNSVFQSDLSYAAAVTQKCRTSSGNTKGSPPHFAGTVGMTWHFGNPMALASTETRQDRAVHSKDGQRAVQFSALITPIPTHGVIGNTSAGASDSWYFRLWWSRRKCTTTLVLTPSWRVTVRQLVTRFAPILPSHYMAVALLSFASHPDAQRRGLADDTVWQYGTVVFAALMLASMAQMLLDQGVTAAVSRLLTWINEHTLRAPLQLACATTALHDASGSPLPSLGMRVVLTALGALPAVAVRLLPVAAEWALVVPGAALIVVAVALNPTMAVDVAAIDSVPTAYKAVVASVTSVDGIRTAVAVVLLFALLAPRQTISGGTGERVLAVGLAVLPLMHVPCALSVHYCLWAPLLVATARTGAAVCKRCGAIARSATTAVSE